MKSVLTHGLRAAVPLIAVPLLVVTVYAAGNSGSTGKPMNTNANHRDASPQDAVSMDDHTDSALNKKHDRHRPPGPRTSKKAGNASEPHQSRGTSRDHEPNDAATEAR